LLLLLFISLLSQFGKFWTHPRMWKTPLLKEANSHSSSQGIPHLFIETKVHYRVHKSPIKCET